MNMTFNFKKNVAFIPIPSVCGRLGYDFGAHDLVIRFKVVGVNEMLTLESTYRSE